MRDAGFRSGHQSIGGSTESGAMPTKRTMFTKMTRSRVFVVFVVFVVVFVIVVTAAGADLRSAI
jgi:hypothetical protein